MGPSCPLRIAHFGPAQEKKVHEADLQGYNFWTKSTTKLQKEAEDSQSKEKINHPLGIVVLQTQLAIFPGP